MTTKQPHKHAAFIKAWADGVTIQFRNNENQPWNDLTPNRLVGWYEESQYRIKPKPDPKWYRIALYKGKPVVVCEDASVAYWEGVSGFQRWLTDKVEY